jgi:hypothetical protein
MTEKWGEKPAIFAAYLRLPSRPSRETIRTPSATPRWKSPIKNQKCLQAVPFVVNHPSRSLCERKAPCRRPRLSHNACACQIVCGTPRTEYAYAVLCEICQKRHANVHKTTTFLEGHPPNRKSTVGPTRHLCEVCAGHKTEEAWDAEQKERAAASRQRFEQNKAFSRAIREELFESRRDLMTRNQIRLHGMAVERHWKIALLKVSSLLADIDPLNVLFGPIKTGINHVVQHLNDCEVHVIRSYSDPKQQMDYLFEIFPNAGASLDLEKKLLFVEAADTLFPDVQRSRGFCSLAAGLIGSGTRADHFQFWLKGLPPLL